MFRFGVKKEQNEMLGRTIAELRELRAELSVLRDSLRQIVPENQEEEEEIRADSSGQGQDTKGVLSAAEGTGECERQSREETRQEAESTGSEIVDLPSAKDAGEVESLKEDKVDQGNGEEAYTPPRDWAVVNFFESRRPWWKIWETKDRTTKRSV